MIDYMIWPWFERIQSLPHLYDDTAKLPSEKFPTLVRPLDELFDQSIISLIDIFFSIFRTNG